MQNHRHSRAFFSFLGHGTHEFGDILFVVVFRYMVLFILALLLAENYKITQHQTCTIYALLSAEVYHGHGRVI